MIYLNLAEPLNPVSTLSLFFCKRIQIRTSSRYVLDIFTISRYAKVIFGDPGAVRRVGRSGAKIVFKPCLVTILKPLYCFLSAVGVTFIYFLSFKRIMSVLLYVRWLY